MDTAQVRGDDGFDEQRRKGQTPLNWSPSSIPASFRCLQLNSQKGPVKTPLLGSEPLWSPTSLTEKSLPDATYWGCDLTPGYLFDPISFLQSHLIIQLQPH